MEHKTATTTATPTTDRGSFTAIAAAYSVDRQGERIAKGAFGTTITQWQASGKAVPLHWDHRGEAANVIGHVDPMSVKETSQGLHVAAQLDIEESAVAREAWRLVKKNVVGLSFGFLVKRSHRDGKVRVLDEIDLFEVSITPSPANADTRILDWKSASGAESDPASMEIMIGMQRRFAEAGRALDAERKASERAEKAKPIEVSTFDC